MADETALAQVVGAAAASRILARLGGGAGGGGGGFRLEIGMLIWVSLGQSGCEGAHRVDLLISAFGAGVLCPPGSRGVERFGGFLRTVPPFVTAGDYRNFSAELAATVATGCRPCAQESNARAFGAMVCPPCPRSTFLSGNDGGVPTCQPCPPGTGTFLTGAVSPDGCIDMCAPGVRYCLSRNPPPSLTPSLSPPSLPLSLACACRIKT